MKKKILLTLAGFLFVSIILGIIYLYQSKTRNAVETMIAEKKIINVLVAGSNVYNENRHNFYMIASINPENSRIGVTFLPPTMMIKFNGRVDKAKKISDIDLSDFDHIRETIEADIKLSVPFYVEVYSPDIERFTDLIGGIELFILDQVKDPGNFGFGINYVDGKKTMKYINSAELNSIYVKYDRILDLMLTLVDKRESLADYCTMDFVIEVFKSIKTNLLPQEILTLAELSMKTDDLVSTVLPGTQSGGMLAVDDISYKIYERDFYKSLVLDPEPEGGIKVKLLNGTSVPGLARRVRSNLIRDGLNVAEFGTFEKQKVPHSMIINRRGAISSARRVSEIAGISTIHHIVDSTQLNTALVIIGEDIVK